MWLQYSEICSSGGGWDGIDGGAGEGGSVPAAAADVGRVATVNLRLEPPASMAALLECRLQQATVQGVMCARQRLVMRVVAVTPRPNDPSRPLAFVERRVLWCFQAFASANQSSRRIVPDGV